MILGIDYGLRHIGLATSEGLLAEPYETVQIRSINEGIKEIEHLVVDLKIEKIVMGISEGKSKTAALGFANKLKSVLRLPIELVDETLTTAEAQSKSRSRTRDQKEKEHAMAAAIILQRYLDS